MRYHIISYDKVHISLVYLPLTKRAIYSYLFFKYSTLQHSSQPHFVSYWYVRKAFLGFYGSDSRDGGSGEVYSCHAPGGLWWRPKIRVSTFSLRTRGGRRPKAVTRRPSYPTLSFWRAQRDSIDANVVYDFCDDVGLALGLGDRCGQGLLPHTVFKIVVADPLLEWISEPISSRNKRGHIVPTYQHDKDGDFGNISSRFFRIIRTTNTTNDGDLGNISWRLFRI